MKKLCLLAVAASMAITSAWAQERTAGQAYDAQINWSMLSGKLNALDTQNKALAATIEKMNTCSSKKMIYTPADSAADSDGCVGISSKLSSDYCYAQAANRWQGVTCEEGYYLKSMIKSTDNNWDGYGAVCCYSGAGKDARVEKDRAGFLAKAKAAAPGGGAPLAATLGMSYRQIVNSCKVNPGSFGSHRVTCPYLNVLAK